MRRRHFMALLGSAATWPLAARAQQAERMRRIGVLMPLGANDPEGQAYSAAFLEGLRQAGWNGGRNVQVDYRWSAGNTEIRKYAAELAALTPDVILATGPAAVAAGARCKPHGADRVRAGARSGRRRLRR